MKKIKRDEAGQLTFDDSAEPIATQIVRRSLLNSEDLLNAAGNARIEDWAIEAGYKNPLSLIRLSLKPDFGRSANEWARDGRFGPTTCAMLSNIGMAFELFWSSTGAPVPVSAVELDWLLYAFLVHRITTAALSAGSISNEYRVLRRYALFCRNLPESHSEFAAVLRMQAANYRPVHPPFNHPSFDRRVQEMCGKYHSWTRSSVHGSPHGTAADRGSGE